MAAQRAPRATAGNRMARVLEEEGDEDDFYKTTYGGFSEEVEDGDFHSDQEDSADEVDSDFDNPEEEEQEEGEPDDKPKRRKKAAGVQTKAYKEPKKDVAPKDPTTSAVATPKDKEAEKKKRAAEKAAATPDEPMRKSSRGSTAKNSLLTNLREKDRQEFEKVKKGRTKKSTVNVRRLTQEELLAEAAKTEKKNLKSLENYYKLEANRKKTLTKKKTFNVPTIKMLSVVTDVVEYERRPSSVGVEKESRTFYIYSHDDTFEDTYPWNKPPSKKICLKPPLKKICPVTKKQARFTDPLTKIPYYDLAAFKEIREMYRQTMAEVKS